MLFNYKYLFTDFLSRSVRVTPWASADALSLSFEPLGSLKVIMS